LAACITGETKVSQDINEAKKWFRLVAEKGQCEAQYLLGNMYDKGHGAVPVDKTEAVKWLRLAAEQGHSTAKYCLNQLNKAVKTFGSR
jgi:TPR repeat protein